jgi:hypothetical protein
MNDSPSITDPLALYCPTCAYDVRYTMEDRCPECGMAFTRSELGCSRIPWVHRGRIGKAFGRTVFFGMGSSGKLAQEMAGPVAWRDANRFRWAVVIAATVLATVAVGCVYPFTDLKQFHVDYNEWAELGITSSELPMSPLGYPLAALWTGPGLIAVMGVGVFAASLGMSGWFRACFWMFGGGGGGEWRERASCIGLYAFAWWIPTCACLSGMVCIGNVAGSSDPPGWMMGLFFVLEGGAIVSAVLWMVRALLLLRATTGCRGGKLVLAALVMPVGMVVAAVFCVVGVDYGMGLAGLVLSSFQR